MQNQKKKKKATSQKGGRGESFQTDEETRCGGTSEVKESSKSNGEQTFPRLDEDFIYLGSSSESIQPLQIKHKRECA